MLTRTWPYGTTRRAEVLEAGACTLVLVDELGEGHVLLGTRSAGKPGDQGTLTFTAGGPTGGYWKFEPDAQEPTLA